MSSGVSTVCEKCGAVTPLANAFCTRCGTQRGISSQAPSSQRFCVKCGSPVAGEAKFCEKCGTPVSATAATTSSSEEAKPALQVVSRAIPKSSATPSPGASKALKIVMIVVAVFMVFLIVVTGSCAYIAYRAKEKAHSIEEAYKQNDVNKLASELGISDASHGNRETGKSSTSSSSPPSPPAAPYGWTEQNGKLVPAPAPISTTPRPPKADPVIPVPATGNQPKDWALRYERTENGPEADLVVRTGDINNLGFGWPQGFDPFSGNSTPPHQWPDINKIPAGAPDGTDRILIGSAVIPGPGDGYSGAIGDCGLLRDMTTHGPTPSAETVSNLEAQCKRERDLTAPTPILLSVGKLPAKIDFVLVQMFVDDFQPMPMHSHFQVSLNGTRIPSFEYAMNALDQSGPIGKLLSLKLLPEYWPLLQQSTTRLLIDDPTTHVPDGYAVDFVRILVNPHNFKYAVSLNASVIDADKHTAISSATVTAGLQSVNTDVRGKCQLSGLPAGLVIATAAAPGYDENSVPVDLPSGQTGQIEIQLHAHQEGTAALEKQIAQTGSATLYGIHFDTDSAKLRPDSMPALNAVLGLINNHPGSQWVIAGHTDNQGNAGHNQALSENRAASVITWLKGHGVSSSRFSPQGFGATRPVADNTTAGGRALNRRVEISMK
jgi:OmpA-OmpF porin, OOP family